MGNKIMRDQILKFWYIVEFLNQADFPYFKGNPVNEKSSKTTIRHTFNDVKEIYSTIEYDDNTIKHLPFKSDLINICLGKVSRNQCVDAIYKLMGHEDKRVEPTKGHIAFIGLQVSTLKRYIAHSFNVSPIIWTIYKMRQQNSADLSMLINQSEYKKDLEEIENWLMNQDDITEDILNKLYEKVKMKFIASDLSLDVSNMGFFTYQRFKDEKVKEQNEEQLNDSSLNMTFFTQDLNMIINLNKKDLLSFTQYGKSFIEPYITCGFNDMNRQRINLLSKSKESIEAFKRILHVDNSPFGKWPSRYAPVLMQQVAINMAVSSNDKFPSCISVNGPPGTGKTTMLKEIIADATVKKAIQMMRYENSDDAFTECNYKDGKCQNHGYNNYFPHYYKVNDNINQYSILVASYNNAAVENITKELPDGEALCDSLTSMNNKDKNEISLKQLHDLFDKQDEDVYYTEYANALFNAKDAKKPHYYWGLISAPLGNRSNQGKVIRSLQRISREILKSHKDIETHKVSYKEARNQFHEQLKKVLQEREKLRKACNADSDLKAYIKKINKKNKSCDAKIKKIDKEKEILAINVKEALSEMEKLENKVKNDEHETQLEKKNVNEHENIYLNLKGIGEKIEKEIIQWESKRSFLDVLLAFLKIRTLKNIKIQSLYEELYANERKIKDAKKEFESEKRILDSMIQNLSAVKYDMEEQEKIISNCNRKLKSFDRQQEKLKSEIQANDRNKCKAENQYNNWLDTCKKKKKDYNSYDILDYTFFHSLYGKDCNASLAAHLMNPWMSEKYNREREKLFFCALKVNREFILSSKFARSNLKNLLMMWTGTDGENPVKFTESDKDAAYPALLQTLSIIIPVISTTFASLNRFLNHVKEPFQLGTLIIDEAGQAQPYTALGALVRCRKAIIVGDPKQIEPVVKDDLDAIKQLLRNKYTAPYLDKSLSVQQFADKLNPYGTYFKNTNGEDMWVGCPLVVHRRCINPMFDISNTISYSGIMKLQTKEPNSSKKEKLALSYSQWIQCAGKENDHRKKDHFVKEQGQEALKIIEQAILKADDNIPHLFVISPFNSVVNGMKNLLKSSNLNQQYNLEKWINENIGTIHTFQGKEADEVVLLLGCDQDAFNAIKWVNTNIINVAVTRAKYRLCVIGDYHIWKKNKHIRMMKGIIDAYTIKELEKIQDKNLTSKTINKAKLLLNRLPSLNDFMEQSDDDNQINTYDFMRGLRIVNFDMNNLSNEEMEKYHIYDKDLKELSYQARSHLIAGIKINSIFDTLLNSYGIDFHDRSFKNILFCKATEINVRDSFIEGLRKHFPEYKLKGKLLKEIKENCFMLGTTAHLLDDKKKEIALILNDQVYDEQWWGLFTDRLRSVGQLRNECCHTGDFSLEQEKKMLKLLFEEMVFKDIKIGKRIKNAKRLAVHD